MNSDRMPDEVAVAKGVLKPLLYSPEIEQAKPDEAEAIDGIIAAMTKQSEIVAGREHHTVRASHAKSTGVVVGELIVQPNLPAELAQGLFAKPGTYEVAVRFAQGPGEITSDKMSTHRGMAIKVFGVEGEKLTGHADDTQDFVLATGTVFPSGTAQQFLKDEKQILAATKLPVSLGTGLKTAISNIAQTVTKMVGGEGNLLRQERRRSFQQLAAEAFNDLLDKYGHPVDIKNQLRVSLGKEPVKRPGRTRKNIEGHKEG